MRPQDITCAPDCTQQAAASFILPVMIRDTERQLHFLKGWGNIITKFPATPDDLLNLLRWCGEPVGQTRAARARELVEATNGLLQVRIPSGLLYISEDLAQAGQ